MEQYEGPNFFFQILYSCTLATSYLTELRLTSLITWDSVAWLSSSSTTIGSAEAILQFGLSIADLLVLDPCSDGWRKDSSRGYGSGV